MRGVSPRDALSVRAAAWQSERRADDPGPTTRRTRLDLPCPDGALSRIGVGAETQAALDLAVTQEVDDGAGPGRYDAPRAAARAFDRFQLAYPPPIPDPVRFYSLSGPSRGLVA
jgi:hypothetical protein